LVDESGKVQPGLRGRVIDALKGVVDPEIGQDVWSVRLVRELEVGEEGRVRLTFRPLSVTCPLGFSLAVKIREGIGRVPGVKKVELQVKGFQHAEELEALLRRMDENIS
jgi:metal-sulfur cluster biosynthetic enzyme